MTVKKSISKVDKSRKATKSKVGRKKGTAKTGGRKKNTPNKTTALLKDAILQAAENVGNKIGNGGLVSYLEIQATTNPTAFMSLLGKVLPMQVGGIDGEPIKLEGVTIYQLPDNGRSKTD